MMRLQSELKALQDYLQRVHQYHLGAKPAFMQRNHWNEINDALHNSSNKASGCYSLATRIISERADIGGRPTNIREIQGEGPSLGSPE
jgi:hypothetical protein